MFITRFFAIVIWKWIKTLILLGAAVAFLGTALIILFTL